MDMGVNNFKINTFLSRKVLKNNIFVRNVIFTFTTQILCLILSMATSSIIARWLGPQGKGLLTMAILFSSTMVLLLNSGIGLSNAYFAGLKRFSVSYLESNSVNIACIGTALGFLITITLFVAGYLNTIIPEVPVWLIFIAILGLPIGFLSGYFNAILQGLQCIITINIVNILQGSLMLALTFFMVVSFKNGLLGALMAYILNSLLNLVVLTLLLKKEGGTFFSKPNPTVMRSTLSFGLKGHVGNVFQFFNYRLDMFILNYFLGPVNVGIYSVSVALAELLWYFPNAVGFVIFPKAASTKPEVMNIFTPRVFRITLEITSLGALGLLFLGKPIINYVYSSAFLSSYIPMIALLPGVVLLGGAKVLTNEIAGRGYPHYNSINSGVALIITIALDLLLIPRHGILGAAMASSISYAVIFFLAIGFYLFVSRKKEGLSLTLQKTLNENLELSSQNY